MLNHTRIVRDAILISVKRGSPWSYIGCWDDMQEILIRDERWEQPLEGGNVRGDEDSRSSVSSSELSSGCVISGKYGPKENSVMTWERFITVSN
jgi:hypothetical protein